MHDINKQSAGKIKKDFLSKTTQRVHLVIASLYVITVLFLCLKYQIDPVSPIGSLLTTYVFAGIIGWIGWRIARKSDLVANLVFNLSFAFFFIAILVPPALKIYQDQINNMKGETNYSQLAQNDTQNSAKNSLTKESNDEISSRKLEIEGAIKNQMEELGYQVNEVKLNDVVDMGNEYKVYCFLYKSDQFIGAYFLCPSAKRYVVYDTAQDMEKFMVFLNLQEDQKAFWIRDIFSNFAGFTFPE